jgi:penicillin amidase
MKRIGKVLLVIGLILSITAASLAGLGAWFVRRPWPKVQGTVTVSGLSAPVEVLRDRWGVPQIYAQNEHDLFFAQGYVHAQDRLWQMEFNRRVSSGTLSAALGEGTLDLDRFLRTLGLRQAAERDWAMVDEETRTVLEAYAQGVNTYIETHRKRLPLEFSLLGVDPAPWTPIDSLAWGQVMSLFLSHNYEFELLRADMIAELGERAAAELLPPYSREGPVIVPPEAGGYAWLQGSRVCANPLAELVQDTSLDWGSNNWVVHGSRTASGLPLLANDMHLGLDMPSIWYEIGLHGSRFSSVGYSFPGAPAVIVGHNGQIVWGVTTLPADVQDLYIEKLDDAQHPTHYEFEGAWQELEIREEIIEVKDGEAVTLQVLTTHHGPIINDVVGDLAEAQPLALRWTSLEGVRLFQSVLRLNLAANWDEFRQALRLWDGPSQNFVYADLEGNIGYQAPGLIPVRAPGHQGTVPVPGWTGEYEWQGYVPFDEMPSSLNPPTGFVASANNKVTSDDYAYYLAFEWAAPYRSQRITDLLAANDRASPEDMSRIQADTYSLPAEALRPILLAVEPQDDLEAQALALVETWDLRLEKDSAGASIYNTWYWFLVQNTLRDDLDNDLLESYLGSGNTHVPMMASLAQDGSNPWFDDVTTPESESLNDMAGQSLTDAVTWLQAGYGDDPAGWAWGRLHTKTFIHQPLGQSGLRLLENLFNGGPIPARGDGFTVDAAGYSFVQPFAMGAGVSQRLVVDVADLDAARSIHTTGQSGHLFHPHRQDMIPLWQNVEYHNLPFSREVVEAGAEAILLLKPAQPDS